MNVPPWPAMAAPPGFTQHWLPLSLGWVRLIAGGRGRPMVMVHGLGGGVEDFFGLAPILAARRACLLVDLPGFGLSDKPDAPYTPAWYGSVLAELVQVLGLERPAWIGHSMGGMIALWLAIHRPELVERVAAVCPAGGALKPGARQRLLMGLLTRGDRLRLFSPGLARLAVAYVFGETPWGPASPARRQVGQRTAALWSGPRRPLLERALIRAGRAILDNPIHPEAGRIKAPALLVTGRGDHITPPDWTDRLRLHLPAGTPWVQVAGGHMPVYLAVEELASAVAGFLA